MGSVTSMVGPRPADQARMMRDVANMFDELRALADRHAELHADRARLQADVDQLDREHRAGLERPWWRLHRLLGQ
jgi:predicted secreted Zn-dependent protease